MRRISEECVRTTIYLSRDAKRLAEEEIDNLSKWVNDQILVCLSCETVADVEAKKQGYLDKVRVLDARIKELKLVSERVSGEKGLEELALGELRSGFVYRRNSRIASNFDKGWIRSPKNIGRCKILKKNPEEVLFMLEEWYNETKGSQEK